MISYKENRSALENLGVTFKAIRDFEEAIRHFSEDKVGPAYVKFEHWDYATTYQIDRKLMVTALEAQRQKLITYLAAMGIDYNA